MLVSKKDQSVASTLRLTFTRTRVEGMDKHNEAHRENFGAAKTHTAFSILSPIY